MPQEWRRLQEHFLLMLSVLIDLTQEQKSSPDTLVEGSVSMLSHLVFLTLLHCCKITPLPADTDVHEIWVVFCSAPAFLISDTRCHLQEMYG